MAPHRLRIPVVVVLMGGGGGGLKILYRYYWSLVKLGLDLRLGLRMDFSVMSHS